MVDDKRTTKQALSCTLRGRRHIGRAKNRWEAETGIWNYPMPQIEGDNFIGRTEDVTLTQF